MRAPTGLTLALIIIICAPQMAVARGHGGGHTSSGRHPASYCKNCQRDSHGRIRRDPAERKAFMIQTGHPHGWKGHIIDHKVPLKRGGQDDPSNMQWQTTEEAKQKDRTE